MKINYIDDIPAGKEIDEMVAEKVMGWHKGNYVFLTGKTIGENNNDWLDTEERYMCGIAREDVNEDDEDFNLLHWHPSQSILWAWQVVEKMRASQGHPIEIKGDEWYDGGGWLVNIYDPTGTKILVSAKDTTSGPNRNPPNVCLAICRAALKAIRHRPE